MSDVSCACPLCEAPGGIPIWQGRDLHVVRAQEEGFPAFYRVIWAAHVAEFSDLSSYERTICMDTVATVEHVLRQQLVPTPTKINLAALGNMVPHLHWHVIARYDWDSHYPAPIWAESVRPRSLAQEAQLQAQLPDIDTFLVEALTIGATIRRI